VMDPLAADPTTRPAAPLPGAGITEDSPPPLRREDQSGSGGSGGSGGAGGART
jgi:hypothetical protein